jgi:hypothetical protein
MLCNTAILEGLRKQTFCSIKMIAVFLAKFYFFAQPLAPMPHNIEIYTQKVPVWWSIAFAIHWFAQDTIRETLCIYKKCSLNDPIFFLYLVQASVEFFFGKDY